MPPTLSPSPTRGEGGCDTVFGKLAEAYPPPRGGGPHPQPLPHEGVAPTPSPSPTRGEGGGSSLPILPEERGMQIGRFKTCISRSLRCSMIGLLSGSELCVWKIAAGLRLVALPAAMRPHYSPLRLQFTMRV